MRCERETFFTTKQQTKSDAVSVPQRSSSPSPLARTLPSIAKPKSATRHCVYSESSTRVLAISGQHVAVLAAMVYLVLRLFAVPMLFRNPAVLGLMCLYIFVAGAPPSAIRAGVVASFVLVAPLFGRQLSPLNCTN